MFASPPGMAQKLNPSARCERHPFGLWRNSLGSCRNAHLLLPLKVNKRPAPVTNLQILIALQPGQLSCRNLQMACGASSVEHGHDRPFPPLHHPVVVRKNGRWNDRTQTRDLKPLFPVTERGRQRSGSGFEVTKTFDGICNMGRCWHAHPICIKRATFDIKHSCY